MKALVRSPRFRSSILGACLALLIPTVANARYWTASGVPEAGRFGSCKAAAFTSYYDGPTNGNPPHHFSGAMDDDQCVVTGRNSFHHSTGAGWATLHCPAGMKKFEGRCLQANPQAGEQCGVANPIMPLSGSKHETEVDYSTGGANPLTFVRHYGRLGGGFWSQADASRFGRGWRSNYDAILIPIGAPVDEVRITLADGKDIVLTRVSGVFQPAYVDSDGDILAGRTGVAERLLEVGSTYELHDRNDTIWVFNSAGQLIEIRERGGYVRTLTYDSNGLNTGVTDSFGRQLTFTYDGDRRLLSLQAPGGHIFTYAYDVVEGVDEFPPPVVSVGWGDHMKEASVLVAVTRPDFDTRSYHYENADFPFALTGITDERGTRYSTFAYDSLGSAVSSSHSGGADLTVLDYSVAGQVTVTNPLGKETVYDYTVNAQKTRLLTEIIGEASPNCPMSNSTFEYDANNFRSAQVDEEGNRTEWTNNARGLPTVETRAAGTAEAVTTNYTWHATFRVPTLIEAPRLTTALSYNSAGALTGVTQTDTTTHTIPYPTGGETRSWAYTYTTGGLLETANGPLTGSGDTIDYDYDANGYLTAVTNELGHVTDVTAVNGRGQPTSITDPNGKVYTLAYDALGRLTSVTEELTTDRVTAFEYDAIGQITKVTLGDGSFLSYTYNAARRLTGIGNTAGESIAFTHDAMGNVTSRTVKDSAATIVETQSRTYDELGRLLSLIGAASQTWTLGYDKTGNLTDVEDPRANVFSYAYDGLNRLIALTDEDNAETEIPRNAQGDIASLTDPNSVVTSFVRNGFGDIIREQSPDTGTTDYVRNALGLVTQKTDGRGIVAQYSYDDAGRLTAIAYPGATAENVTLTYDDTASGNKGVGPADERRRPAGRPVLRLRCRRRHHDRQDHDGRRQLPGGLRLRPRRPHDPDDLSVGPHRLLSPRRPTGASAQVKTQQDLPRRSPSSRAASTTRPFSDTVANVTFQNGLVEWRGFDNDGRIAGYGVRDGTTQIFHRVLTYADGINLTRRRTCCRGRRRRLMPIRTPTG